LGEGWGEGIEIALLVIGNRQNVMFWRFFCGWGRCLAIFCDGCNILVASKVKEE
jgi:hypothetical protein